MFNAAPVRVAWRLAAIAAFVIVLTAFSSAFSQEQVQEQVAEQVAQRSFQHDPGQRNGGIRADRNQPGDFDFYVLALSWSPSFCEAARERNPDRIPQQQCGPRPFSFVVHGLWPQHERGFPRACKVPPPRLNRGIVDSMLDIMPSPRLVFDQWDKHGTCSGLKPQGYFDSLRRARELTVIPPQFKDVTTYLTVTPDEVEKAFVAANPGMSRAAISVICDQRRLSEVRICMTKDLRFRDCEEIDRRACRRDKLVMPPMRGG
jgi:ribonuclease T2